MSPAAHEDLPVREAKGKHGEYDERNTKRRQTGGEPSASYAKASEEQTDHSSPTRQQAERQGSDQGEETSTFPYGRRIHVAILMRGSFEPRRRRLAARLCCIALRAVVPRIQNGRRDQEHDR